MKNKKLLFPLAAVIVLAMILSFLALIPKESVGAQAQVEMEFDSRISSTGIAGTTNVTTFQNYTLTPKERVLEVSRSDLGNAIVRIDNPSPASLEGGFTLEAKISSKGLDAAASAEDKIAVITLNNKTPVSAEWWVSPPDQVFFLFDQWGVTLWDSGDNGWLALAADTHYHIDDYETERWNDFKVTVHTDGANEIMNAWLNEVKILDNYTLTNKTADNAHITFGAHMRAGGHSQRYKDIVITDKDGKVHASSPNWNWGNQQEWKINSDGSATPNSPDSIGRMHFENEEYKGLNNFEFEAEIKRNDKDGAAFLFNNTEFFGNWWADGKGYFFNLHASAIVLFGPENPRNQIISYSGEYYNGSSDTYNHLRVVVNDGKLDAFINGHKFVDQHVISGTDWQLGQGATGVNSGIAGGDTKHIELRNVMIKNTDTDSTTNYFVSANVNFDSQGGTSASPIGPIKYGTAYGSLPATTRTGYNFNGWYDGGLLITNESIMNKTGHHTLAAEWTANSYTVTFDKQGGSGGDDSVQATFDSAMPPATAPTRDGYTFGGYYAGENGAGTKYYNADMTSANNWDIASATILYAKWTANTYTVTFDPQSGTVSPTTQSVTFASTYGTLPTPTRTGYDFNGWFTEPSGGTQVTSSTTVSITDAQTLYARWTANTYTVTFDPQSGTVSPTTQSVTFASTYGALPTPTRTGYDFNGWFTEPSGGTQVTSSTTVSITDAQTLYARWTAKQYTVTLDKQDGTGGDDSVQATFDSAMPEATAPTRPGYTFGGYWEETGGTGTQYYNAFMESVIDWDIASATTLYAQWTINTYTVTFKDYDGETELGTSTVDHGTHATPPRPSRAGYRFIGWDKSFRDITGDVTLTAQYVSDTDDHGVSVKEVSGEYRIYVENHVDDFQYQVWTFQNIESGIPEVPESKQWVQASGYVLGSDLTVEGDKRYVEIDTFDPAEENKYTVSVRIIDSYGNYFNQIIAIFTPGNIGKPVITQVKSDGEVAFERPIVRNIEDGTISIEVTHNKLDGSEVEVKVVGEENPLTESEGTFTWNISGKAPGNYQIVVKVTNNGNTDEKIIRYILHKPAEISSFAKLDNRDGVAFDQGSREVSFNPNATGAGHFLFTVSEPWRSPIPDLRLSSATSKQTLEIPSGAYGIYQAITRVYRAGSNTTDDGFIQTVTYDRGVEKTLTVDVGEETYSGGTVESPVGEQITITPTATIGSLGAEQIKYSYWRRDANGWVMVRDYAEGGLTWTPARIGDYTIQVRVKGEGAGSYEMVENVEFTITHGEQDQADVSDLILDYGSPVERTPILIQATAISEEEDLLYKYIISNGWLYYVETSYSADPTYTFVPGKAGEYRISVLVKNRESFGKFDYVKTFDVTVAPGGNG